MNELRGQAIFQLLRQRNFRNFYEGLDYSRAEHACRFLNGCLTVN
jgi:hypothetical protein